MQFRKFIVCVIYTRVIKNFMGFNRFLFALRIRNLFNFFVVSKKFKLNLDLQEDLISAHFSNRVPSIIITDQYKMDDPLRQVMDTHW